MDGDDLVRRAANDGSVLAREFRLGHQPVRMWMDRLLTRADASDDARPNVDRRRKSSRHEVVSTDMPDINRALYCSSCGSSELKNFRCMACGGHRVGTKPPQMWMLTYNDRLLLKVIRITAE
jgi:ribosomal protein L32